jgi:hypothetical protein
VVPPIKTPEDDLKYRFRKAEAATFVKEYYGAQKTLTMGLAPKSKYPKNLKMEAENLLRPIDWIDNGYSIGGKILPHPRTWAPQHEVKIEGNSIHTPFATSFNFGEAASRPASIESLSPVKKSRPLFEPKTEFATEFYGAGNEDGPNHEFVNAKKKHKKSSSSSSTTLSL